MNLSGSLYEITQSEITDQSAFYSIKLNENDIIYKGHFPGFPVTPGVIQIKLVEELLSKAMGLTLRLDSINQSKFLNVINPNKNRLVEVNIHFKKDGEKVSTQVSFLQNNTIVFKLQAVFSTHE